MSGMFALEGEEFDQLVSAMSEYGEGASDIVSEVIHDSGDIIYQEIDPLIHPSGRTFKGHSSGAQGSHWQRYDTGEPLAITVAANASRRYLYFPDDGSNTTRHYGNQQFMLRGAEAAAPTILQKGVDALIESFERS